MENEEIISKDAQVAEILNTYFFNIVKDLDIEGYKVDDIYQIHMQDQELEITRGADVGSVKFRFY